MARALRGRAQGGGLMRALINFVYLLLVSGVAAILWGFAALLFAKARAYWVTYQPSRTVRELQMTAAHGHRLNLMTLSGMAKDFMQRRRWM